MSKINKKLLEYPFTEMFCVIDTLPVPHPYCISSRHVVYASEHNGGMLTAESIRRAEKFGKAKCFTCKGKLSYDEHKQALLVEVNDPENRELKDVPGLNEYLLSIKEQTEKDGFEGWAFTTRK